MEQIPWSRAVEIIEQHVVRISTPQGSGSGFMISNARVTAICAIATAAHVVDHAHYWEEPIRIDHASSGKSVVIRRDERAIRLDINRDTAAILFNRGELPFPPEPLGLAPKGMFLKVGNEIGWLGFPAIPAASLCFFSGRVSAWLQSQSAYLVDGVAINGVSGGPAFHLLPYEPPAGGERLVAVIGGDEPPAGDQRLVAVVGVVSAYVPNRATGEVLPGLSVVRDVSQFHELAPTFASLDQARQAEPPAEPPQPKPEAERPGEGPVGPAT
jgi:hypothetical protein